MILFITTAVKTSNHTKFHKDWFRNLKVGRGGGYTDTQHGDFISVLLFFKRRKVG
jgi:hypothetical protein